MRTLHMALSVIGAMLFTVACGGSSEDGGTGGAAGTGATGGAAGSSGAGGSAGSAAGSCPSTPPANGSACIAPSTGPGPFADAAHCTWGDDPRPSCRTTALCQQDNTWRVSEPDASLCSTPPLPATCPSPPPAEGSTCADATVSCWYDDGSRCWCSACAGGSGYPNCQVIDPPEWACAPVPADCPTTMPQAGTSCTAEGASCGPSCELEIVCLGGTWQWRQGQCPVCAAPDTPIATPTGERAIAELREGDLVYSVDAGGIVAVPLLRVGSTRVARHRVVRVTLDTGRVLEISPGHPTWDGHAFGDLRVGDRIDEQHGVVRSVMVPYIQERTYDILPASSTGVYFAAGVMVGSTLAKQRTQ